MKSIKQNPGKLRVLSGGLHSLIVSYPGRIGYWRVGIPPSGPMDDYSFRIGNRIIGNCNTSKINHSNAAGLEITYKGPKLEFYNDTEIAITGAKIHNANINEYIDITNKWYKRIQISKGDILDLSDTNISNTSRGCRTYLCIANGGFICNDYLGSKTSFPMGKFGGINNDGAILKEDDILEYNQYISLESDINNGEFNISDDMIWSDYMNIFNNKQYDDDNNNTSMENEIIWEIGVLSGPQSSPDYLTEDDVELLYNTEYEVSHNASRLGIRLNPLGINGDKAPKFSWSRMDGGEGGSHPSNLIDNPYPIGSVNFTGDYPVILTVDGPSLGGFVCPITIPSTELWKVGQLKPSDKVRFKLLNLKKVVQNKQSVDECIQFMEYRLNDIEYNEFNEKRLEPVLYKIEGDIMQNQPKVQYRMGGDRYLLIDYGEDEIDLNLRVRVHKLEEYIVNNMMNGIIDTIPGVKTLLIEYDPLQISLKYLLNILVDIEKNYLCDIMDLKKNEICLESRIFKLPFVFNCEWTNLAIQRYINEVREKAAYLPSNTQFICNNNGLEGGIDELERMIYNIPFLVLGLGDVYLGAPCAIPIDPRQRLNVPKYNPSRNYTPEGAVGIGGKFMCIYPMESPGGYQLIGRTLQIFNKNDQNGKPWLLNMFDQIQFYPVSNKQLIKQREDNMNGRLIFDVIESEFNLNEYNKMYINDEKIKDEINKFKSNQKIYQMEQLKYDKYLLERDDILYNEIICKNILFYQANMIINGAKYGTSLFIYIKETFQNENDIIIQYENFIKPLNKINGKQFNLTLYDKIYNIKLDGIRKQNDENKYDVIFNINGNNQYIVKDIIFNKDNINYVSLQHGILDTNENKENLDNSNVELIYSSLPGKLVKLHINIGDNVNIGDQIATISAMKMETSIHSHIKGKVIYINNDHILHAKAVIAHISI